MGGILKHAVAQADTAAGLQDMQNSFPAPSTAAAEPTHAVLTGTADPALGQQMAQLKVLPSHIITLCSMV